MFWTKYEGDLAYIERSIKPIGAPYIGEERARNPLRLGDATGDP